MTSRIVVFGATGYTGRLIAERLAAPGERPVLAGRSRDKLAAGRRAGRAETGARRRHAHRPVFAGRTRRRAGPTVGPFVKWGEPAVRAAIAAGAVYLDSTGEPPFIRRVFEEFGPARPAAGPAAHPPWATTSCRARWPGRSLQDAGEDAVRVDVGYYALGRRAERQRRHARVARRRHARRRPRLPRRPRADRAPGRAVRSSRSATASARRSRSAAPSTSGCRPPIRGCARSTSTSAGSARSRGRCRRGAGRLGAPAPAGRCPRRCSSPASAGALAEGPEAGTTPGGQSRIVAAEAYDASRRAADRGPPRGGNWYAFTADFIAWAARARRRARRGRRARWARSRRSGSSSSAAARRPGLSRASA